MTQRTFWKARFRIGDYFTFYYFAVHMTESELREKAKSEGASKVWAYAHTENGHEETEVFEIEGKL